MRSGLLIRFILLRRGEVVSHQSHKLKVVCAIQTVRNHFILYYFECCFWSVRSIFKDENFQTNCFEFIYFNSISVLYLQQRVLLIDSMRLYSARRISVSLSQCYTSFNSENLFNLFNHSLAQEQLILMLRSPKSEGAT